ncbi:hypothetical protein [Paenibacillus nasutitermitis]|uniref:Uncharacterized protein n=1 Tax=Paenibacillus nasutitermitis TaxID=1652958 RepID=A0A917DQT0_9BACL|nr:hypothetical protein [Paenibacillus nasutitermitis]GGD60846.1 hypothetical protein GCM10010911_18390 [Paenibacillus nasutitermitis]
MRMARIGVLSDQQATGRRHRYGINVFETYIGEVLAHAGLPFQWINRAEDIQVYDPDVLIIALAEEDPETEEAIWAYSEQGGTVISYGGLNRLATRLGCYELRELPVGYTHPDQLGAFGDVALRHLGAKPWDIGAASAAYGAQSFGTLCKDTPDGTEAGAVRLQFNVGQGRIDRWSVNIPKTIVMFQQGTGPVIHDGVPARDGTGSVDEGILKADDACGMDWELDRLHTETGAPYFAYPYADIWRERLIAHLLQIVTGKGMTVPLIGYWPDGVPCVATISHDSDHNIDESAETTLEVLKECGIHSTWCMIEPGYSPSVYERVLREGHELAFHYNALDVQNGRWGGDEFGRQFEWLKQATGLHAVTSNKNHYTRYEGWGELFEWCEQNGIQADQTRGPSKKGNIGFIFGTCHPYFPIAWFDQHNRLYDVLEISFLTQDLDHISLADSSVVIPFLEQTAKAEGAAHFLFHQIHIHQQPAVTDALRKVVDEAVKRGFRFWTSEQINQWERARREIRIDGIDEQGEIRASGTIGVNDIIVYLPSPDKEAGPDMVERFGVPCRKVVLNRSASNQPV